MDLNNREIEVKTIGFCLLLWFFYLEKLGVKKQNSKNAEIWTFKKKYIL